MYFKSYTKKIGGRGVWGERKPFIVKSENQFVFIPDVFKIVAFPTPLK